jgi:hypothetical protein
MYYKVRLTVKPKHDVTVTFGSGHPSKPPQTTPVLAKIQQLVCNGADEGRCGAEAACVWNTATSPPCKVVEPLELDLPISPQFETAVCSSATPLVFGSCGQSWTVADAMVLKIEDWDVSGTKFSYIRVTALTDNLAEGQRIVPCPSGDAAGCRVQQHSFFQNFPVTNGDCAYKDVKQAIPVQIMDTDVPNLTFSSFSSYWKHDQQCSHSPGAIVESRTVLECMALCGEKATCLGFQYATGDAERNDCQLSESGAYHACSDRQYDFFERKDAAASDSLNVYEDGGISVYSVQLTSVPTDVLIVELAVSDVQRLSVTTTKVVFYPADWNVAKLVYVTGINNDVDEGDHFESQIDHVVISDAFGYRDQVAPIALKIHQINDDEASASAELASLVLAEGTGETTLKLKLGTEPRAAVHLTLSAKYSDSSQWYEVDAAVLADQRAKMTAACAVATLSDACSRAGFCTWDGLMCKVAAAEDAKLIQSGRRPEADEQMTFSPRQIVIQPAQWKESTQVVVRATDDMLTELQQQIIAIATVTSDDTEYQGVSVVNMNGPIVVNDDDTAQASIVNEAGQVLTTALSIPEETGGKYFIALSREPARGAVFIQFSSDGVLTHRSGMVIGASEWAQTSGHAVALEPADQYMDTDEGVSYNSTVVHTLHGAAFVSQTMSDVQVTIFDDDESSVSFRCDTHPCPFAEAGAHEMFVSLTARPTATVTINLDAKYDQANINAIKELEKTKCVGSTSSSACLSLPYCIWQDGHDAAEHTSPGYDYRGPVAADTDVPAVDDCAHLVLVDACAIMLELESEYTIEQLEKEMDCSKAKYCAQNVPTGAVGSSCILNADALSTLDARDATVSGAVTAIFEPAAWNVAQPITLTMSSDGFCLGDRAINLEYSVTSTDEHYTQVPDNTIVPGSSHMVIDIDSADPIITLAVASQSASGAVQAMDVTEGDDTPTVYKISLSSEPMRGAVFVNVEPDPRYAADLIIAPPILAFSPDSWSTPQRVSVTAVDNNVDDGDYARIKFSHTIITGVFGYKDYIPKNDLDVLVANDDHTAAVLVTSSSFAMSESGSATYGVHLASPPREKVFITIVTSDLVHLQATPATLFFNTSTFATTQLVEIKAQPNDIDTGDAGNDISSYFVAHQVAVDSDAPYFALNGGTSLPKLDVHIRDDDTAGVVGIPQNIAIVEGETPATLSITLSSQPTRSVTMTFDLTRANRHTLQQTPMEDLTINPAIIIFTTQNWNEPHIINIFPVDDDSVEDTSVYDLGFIITSTDPMYSIIHKSCQVTISDNDIAAIVSTIESRYVSESSPAGLNLVLTSKPFNDTVTVTMLAKDSDGNVDARYRVSPSTVTFSSANWNIPQSVEMGVVGYSWGTDQTQWSAWIEYMIGTSEPHYRKEMIDKLNVVVMPRQGCDATAIVESSVITSGPGLENEQIMAGDTTTFSIEPKDSNGIICVNSAELLSVEVAGTGSYDYPANAPQSPFLVTTSTEETGALTVSYQVFPYTTYNVFISIGRGRQQRLLKTFSITNKARPAPSAVAAFSNNLNTIEVKFGSDIYGYETHAQSCGSWLTPTSASGLGEKPICAWPSANMAVITLGLGHLGRGSTLEFITGTIKSYNSDWHTGTVVVFDAANPDAPTAVIRAPERQGSCGSLKFDGENSLGASTTPLNFEWSMNDETKQLLRQKSLESFRNDFAAYLLQSSDENIHSLEYKDLPAASLVPSGGVKLILELRVTNSHGLSGYTTAVVTLDSEPLPTVVISGPKHHYVREHVTTRVQPLSFVGMVSLHEECLSAFTDSQRTMSFNWDLRNPISGQLVAETTDQRHFALPKHRLDIGSYILTFTASSANGRANSASVSIQIVRSLLVASLGPQNRQYHPDEQIVLDGTASSDPDMDECKVDCTVLQYVWQCHVGTEDCGLPAPGVQSPRWILASPLRTATDYRFSLTIVDAGDSGRHNSTTSQMVSVVQPTDYAVTLAAHYEPAKRLTSSDTLALVASASHDITRWDWTLTTHNNNIPSDWLLSAGLTGNSLVFQQHVLRPGETYTFRARAIVGVDAVGHADITVEVNAAPTDRFNAFAVTPATGVALQTNFDFDAGRHWVDDGDLPLTYAFGYYDPSMVLDHELVTSASAAPSSRSRLPAGDANHAFHLTVTVTVYDKFGASAMAETIVQVDKLGGNTATVDYVAAAATTVLKEAKDFGDVDLLLQAGGSIGQALSDKTGTEAAVVRSDVISAIHSSKDHFPRDTATIGRVADSVSGVLTSDVGLQAASNALEVVSSFVPKPGEDVQLDRDTATSMIKSTQSAYEAVKPHTVVGHHDTISGRRLQDAVTATATIHQVSNIVSQSLTSVSANDAANVKPFEWQSTDYKVHAEKSALSNGGVVVATDSQQFDINTVSSPSNHVSVGIMTWLDNPFEYTDSTGSIASNVFRLTLSDDVVLTAQNPVRITSAVRTLQTSGTQQSERYAAVTWDVAVQQWTELDTTVQVPASQGRRLQDATSTDIIFDVTAPPAVEVAVQILTEYYGSSGNSDLAGCSMQGADCATTAAGGLAGETPAGMFIFVQCPANCPAVAGASAVDGNAPTFAAMSSICGAAVKSTGQSGGGIFTFTKRSGGSYQVHGTSDEQKARCLHIGDANCVGAFSQCGADCGNKKFSISIPARGSGTCPYTDGATQQCADNEGACRQADCVGSWSTCDASCSPKVYTVQSEPNGIGAACPVSRVQTCEPGEGACPPEKDTIITATATYSLDIRAIPAGSTARTAFEGTLRSLVVAALRSDNVLSTDVKINSITGGSTIVDFSIEVPSTTAVSTKQLFEANIVRTPSALMINGVTPTVTSAVIEAAGDRDCVGKWGACSADCKRIYTINTRRIGQGAACEPLPHIVDCAAGVDACPVANRDCVGAWTKCDRSCNDKVYSHSVTHTGDGRLCPFNHGEKQKCAPADGDCPPAPSPIIPIVPINDSTWTTGEVAGMVIGMLCIMVIIVFVGWWIMRKRRNNQKPGPAYASPAPPPGQFVPGPPAGPNRSAPPPQQRPPQQRPPPPSEASSTHSNTPVGGPRIESTDGSVRPVSPSRLNPGGSSLDKARKYMSMRRQPDGPEDSARANPMTIPSSRPRVDINPPLNAPPSSSGRGGTPPRGTSSANLAKAKQFMQMQVKIVCSALLHYGAAWQ